MFCLFPVHRCVTRALETTVRASEQLKNGKQEDSRSEQLFLSLINSEVLDDPLHSEAHRIGTVHCAT